ncbi:MAG: molecular chaperone HtpG, partial [Bacteroidota bacterium]
PENESVNKELQQSFSGLFGAMKAKLDHVKEIKVSARLKESASCLVSDKDGMSSNMERIMQKLGKMDEEKAADRILELNVEHPAVKSLKSIYDSSAEDPRIDLFTHVLYDQAVIAEGSKLKDPAAFAQRINQLLVEKAGA